MKAAALALALLAACGTAHAQSIAVDPNRPVNGSCAEVLQPLFAALRTAPLAGGIGRMEVDVQMVRNEAGAIAATPRALGVRNFDPASQAIVLAAFKRAYEAPDREGCVGIFSRRSRWIVRKGGVDAMWAPDDPTVINRPVAATTLPEGVRIELIDPALGFSRIYGPESPTAEVKCFGSSALRDTGVNPPTTMMAPGARYQVRFRLDAEGRVDVVRLPETVPAGSTLAQALEQFVRLARYYPRIGEDCAPMASWVTIVSERPT